MKTVFSEENYVPTPGPPTHQLVGKLCQGHKNLINSFNYHNGSIHKVFGQNTSFGSIDRVQTSFFGKNLTFKVRV